MKQRNVFTALLTAGLVTLTLSACAPAGNTASPAASAAPSAAAVTDSDLAYLQSAGKMVIGYTVYEPMNFEDESGKLTGFDTEFAEAVCAKLGLTPEFVEINWDTKVIELENKSIDCIWNGMTITEELTQNLMVSDPYVKNAQVVVVKADRVSEFSDTASLASVALVAEAGSAAEAVISNEKNLSQASYTSVIKQTDALMEVKAGTSDAAVLDLTLAKAVVGKGDYSDLIVVPDLELSVEEYGIGFRKGSDVAGKVNEAMAALVADGTLPALADKYGLVLAAE